MKAQKTKDLGQEITPLPLTRTVRVDDVKDGEERLLEIGQAEREAIASLLDLMALDRLSFALRLYRRGEGRFVLRGQLLASVTQTCVVSLEPVKSALDIPVEVEFWPVPLIEACGETADETASHGALNWPEPIIDGKIDLGPIIYETLATELDPYPKREGVSFTWSEQGLETPGTEEPEGPFAALEQLKHR